LKVAGDVLGSAGFGEYAVARRVISVLTFPLLVGLGTSTARYVSLATGADSPGATATAYSLAALVIAVPIVIAFGLLALTAPAWFAQLFYGEVHYASLTRPIVVAVAGLYAHTLVYANYRGRLRMWVANLLQLWNLGLVPALAVLASGRNVAAAVEITGVAWLTTAIVVACWGAVRAGLGRWTAHAVRSATRDLLRFGLPRVAGEFALFGFFALPTFYVAHTAGVESAGFLSFALSLVQALSSLFSAVGVLLLPYVSRQVGAGNWERVADVVSRSLAASLLVTLVLVAVLHATLGWLIPLVMGQTFALAVGPARWLITGAIPFVTYTLLREPLDGIAVWPYN
ncbi:MAG: lipopolysaccharide biosynthesis protein, partial [bacterium]